METLAPPSPAEAALQHPETLPVEQLEQQVAPMPEKQGFGGWVKGIMEKYFHSADSITETIDNPGITPQIEAVDQAAESLTDDTLHKVESQLGSNEGGWYERPSSGERFYIKFYENPDQAKVEFIANSIYAKLGIKAVKSEMIEVDGREAIASPEIPSPQPTYREDQKASQEVRDGFVADAFLANWDVVGLNYDNIVQGEDGMYRVDNGGSIIFRAQGDPKEFSPHDIPELETMLNPNFTAGQVFEGITEQEMTEQAKTLVERLGVESIDAIIAESGLAGEAATKVREGLVGRREFLIQRFGLNQAEAAEARPGSRLAWVMERLDEGKEKVRELGIRAREAILSDSQHLENQEISFIDARDEGFMGANFKLTSEQFGSVSKHLEEMGQSGELTVSNGEIRYKSVDGQGDFFVSEAYELTHDGLTIRVAKPGYGYGREVRAAVGLVSIEIPYTDDQQLTAEEMEARVNDVLINLLGVPEGLAKPTPEAESQYKEARYRWHHRLPLGPPTPEQSAEAAKLERREVFPDYHTIVSEGKHHEYEAEHGEFAIFHGVGSGDRIIKILQSGGLMSSHERFRRGLLVKGISSARDFQTGGADSVFVRTIVEGAPGDSWRDFGGYTFVMGPELYDRTDWYAYESDQYGATDSRFKGRQSPEEVFEGQRTRGFMSGNEQMFRTGIPSEAFKAIACEDNPDIRRQVGDSLQLSSEDIDALWDEGPDTVRAALASRGVEQIGYYSVQELLSSDARMQMIDKLHEAGITEVNGVPVEKFVVSAKTVDDFIDISHGRTPRSRKATPSAFSTSEQASTSNNDWI